MPKDWAKAEEEIRKHAKILYPKDKDKQDAYVYGTLRKVGWPGPKKK